MNVTNPPYKDSTTKRVDPTKNFYPLSLLSWIIRLLHVYVPKWQFNFKIKFTKWMKIVRHIPLCACSFIWSAVSEANRSLYFFCLICAALRWLKKLIKVESDEKQSRAARWKPAENSAYQFIQLRSPQCLKNKWAPLQRWKRDNKKFPLQYSSGCTLQLAAAHRTEKNLGEHWWGVETNMYLSVWLFLE